LFLDQEIFESLAYLAEDRASLALLSTALRALPGKGLLSSSLTVPILPFNKLLGRWWRGTNMIVHFSKPSA
jgi:hypothetical protein